MAAREMQVRNLSYSVVPRSSSVVSPQSVLCWMYNVVRQEGEAEIVAVLARRCRDRFLASLEDEESLSAWSSSHLLAASCLLVTAKIFSPTPFSVSRLLTYGGGTFVMQELLDCELLLLSKLGWDVYLGCDPDVEERTAALKLDNVNFL